MDYSPWSEMNFLSSNSDRRDHTHLNFLMTMDWFVLADSIVHGIGKGNLAVFEGCSISETGETTPTKIGVHALDINPYLHEFFEPIPID